MSLRSQWSPFSSCGYHCHNLHLRISSDFSSLTYSSILQGLFDTGPFQDTSVTNYLRKDGHAEDDEI